VHRCNPNHQTSLFNQCYDGISTSIDQESAKPKCRREFVILNLVLIVTLIITIDILLITSLFGGNSGGVSSIAFFIDVPALVRTVIGFFQQLLILYQLFMGTSQIRRRSTVRLGDSVSDHESDILSSYDSQFSR
jgi:hypothetical protein